MIYNKRISVLFLVVILFFSTPGYAQQIKNEKVREENERILDEIQRIRDEIDSLKIITRVKQKQDKDSVELYQSKIEEIQNLIKSKEKLLSNRESLRVLKKELESKKTYIQKELLESKNYLELLSKELASMGVYSDIRIDKIHNYYRNILDKRYEDISDEELDHLFNKAEDFSGRSYYEEFKIRVKVAINNKLLYKEANDALNNPYNEDDIRTLRFRIQEVLAINNNNLSSGEIKISAIQYAEIDSLDLKLSRYRGGVEAIKSIMNQINNDNRVIQFRANRDKENCLAVISTIILPDNNDDTRDLYERYFNLIPYLKKTIESYWSELQDNPLNVLGTAQEKIKQM